ncbi:cytochrome c biogenesis protein CcdA [Nocardia flavorosea]|uniref:cytochrome c biogenesis CcdA family protein n=1 Tax=Nocardia flavorosea TaxID=53429 RepID=UPI00189585BF|nr:cytochrome c biogenesis CcdA family protein [Nocardia flavorosea]MBF6352652.1 cytochrome c biogenesis protein CcdA [Nocardia flavorosea]
MIVLAGVGESFQQTAATGPLLLALGACLLAGLVSFASPCVVPLVPGYLSYLAGLVGAQAPPVTVDQARRDRAAAVAGSGSTAVLTETAAPKDTGRAPDTGRLRVAGAAGLFVAGFTVVFVLATATVFGLIQTLNVNRELLQRLGGVVTIVMGLAFLGLIPILQRDTRMAPRRLAGIAGAPLLGAVFALGWTPCLGPTLSGVMAVAAGTEGTTAARGVALIVAYCAGLGLPFVVLAFGSASALRGVGWLRRNTRTIQVIGGLLLVAVGVALVTGAWDLFIGWVRDGFVAEVTLPI